MSIVHLQMFGFSCRFFVRSFSDFGWLGSAPDHSDRGSTRTAPGPSRAAGRRPRPLSPLDEGPAARLLSGSPPLPMASPPAPAVGHPADPALYAVRLRAPASIGPLGWGWTPHRPPGAPRLRRGGRRGFAPAHAPALGRLKSLGRFVPAAPSAPSATWLGPGVPRGPAQCLLLGPPRQRRLPNQGESRHFDKPWLPQPQPMALAYSQAIWPYLGLCSSHEPTVTFRIHLVCRRPAPWRLLGQSDYGKVILPFTVLRRLDCVLEATKPAALKELEAKTKLGVNPEPFLLKRRA